MMAPKHIIIIARASPLYIVTYGISKIAAPNADDVRVKRPPRIDPGLICPQVL